MKIPSLLLIDDHPIAIDGYVTIFSNYNPVVDFTTAVSRHRVYMKIIERYISKKNI